MKRWISFTASMVGALMGVLPGCSTDPEGPSDSESDGGSFASASGASGDGNGSGGVDSTAGGAGGQPASGGPGGSAEGGASAGGTVSDAGEGGGLGDPSPGGSGGSGGATVATAWPSVGDFGAEGPFPTTRDVDTGPGGTFDVFRPTELGTESRMHPVISWANGTLFSIDEYQAMLFHWASHGFVVIGSHSNSTAGGVTHYAGIEWIKEQNATAGSPYFEVLDLTKIGAAGHSQGGGATLAAGAGEPMPAGLVTTISMMAIPNFEEDDTITGRQLVPTFNIAATEEDRDPNYVDVIYQDANTELVQGMFIGFHEDAMQPAMRAPTLAWFRHWLMDDLAARDYFYPPDTCTLCQDPEWEYVRHKNSP